MEEPEKVECIRDECQDSSYSVLNGGGDVVHYGDIYTVTGEYVHTGTRMLLLDSLKRNHYEFGDGWSETRFRPLKRRKARAKTTEKLADA